MSQIPFMVRLKHVAHMATLRLICPVVLLLKYYQIKIFAILCYALRYFEFSRVSKQKCHVFLFFLNVKNIIDKVKFTLDKCGDVDVVVAMRTRNDFASAYVFVVDYRNLPQLGRSNIRV